MNFLVFLASLMGPIYFGLQGSPVGFVVLWAAIWNTLRGWATRKEVRAELHSPSDGEPIHPYLAGFESWLDRHPTILEFSIPFVTLAVFEALHLAVYWLVLMSVGISK